MAETGFQTTISQEPTGQKEDVMSKIKWFLSKLNKKWWEKSEHKTVTFILTRRDAIISLLVSVAIIVFACFYWVRVMNKYSEMNSKSDELKNISTYNISVNNSINSYVEWSNKDTINWMLEINNNIIETLKNREDFRKEQKNYYETLLQNIYLPSLNVWKNPYTKNFDVGIVWQKYLETDKFQDLYLIQYRSDFIKYVWNDAEYNTIESISLWDIVELGGSDYFYLPITVSFSSPNKRSFLLLVNKLSMTSNTSNISLLNEFFFYLLMNIKERKSEVIDNLMQKYWSDFSTSSSRDWPSNISDLTDEQRSHYQDRVIWYELYNWINSDWTQNDDNLIDDELIVETIKESTMCDATISNSECFYNFRDKYRDLPYLAYKIWMEKQANRTNWFREFLRDMPSVITITNFGFEKHSSSTFLNNEQEKYEWDLTFNAYWRTISSEELDEASTILWNLCFGSMANQTLSPSVALERVNNAIISLWGWSDNVNISSLWELQQIFEEVNSSYNWLSNYNKMIKLFETWRMLNDANLCNY